MFQENHIMKMLRSPFVWILLSCALIAPMGLSAFAAVGSITAITSSQNPSTFGSSVTFTATVVPSSGSIVPTGVVQFNDTNTSPPTTLGTATLDSTGTAAFSISSLSIGSHNIVASYLGDANNSPSVSIILSQTVNPAPLVANGVTISATEGASVSGVVAHFTDNDPGSIASDYAATIDWGDGTTSTAVIVSNSGGGFDVQGTHTYAEEGSFHLSITIVDSDATTTTVASVATVADAPLTSSPININAQVNTSFQGVVAHFTDADPNAVASDYAATIDWGDGTTSTAVIVSNSGGGFDVQGTHTFTAAGSSPLSITIHDAGGSSSTVTGTATISQGSSSITITSSQNPSTFGSSVTFTATISPNTVTGTVQFNDTSTSPQTTLGTSSVSNGVATFTTSSLPSGTHDIVAKYLGDANNGPVTSGTLAQIVNTVNTPTTTVLSANATLIISGQSVNFTAVVSPSTATGTIQFLVNGTSLGSPVTLSGNKASIITSSLPIGADIIVASYSGDSNSSPSTSNSVTVSVTTTQTVTQGKVTGGGHIGKGINFGFEVSSNNNSKKKIRGELEFNDKNVKIKLHSQNITSLSIDPSMTQASFSGNGKLNGKSGFTFSVNVTDPDKTGNHDTFSITITNGTGNVVYQNSGQVKGHIEIHVTTKKHDTDDDKKTHEKNGDDDKNKQNILKTNHTTTVTSWKSGKGHGQDHKSGKNKNSE